MEASIVDLRYNMKEVIKALTRKESVNILYHRKLIGTIIPAIKETGLNITEHPFFGMCQEDKSSVTQKMKKLRRGRFHDL